MGYEYLPMLLSALALIISIFSFIFFRSYLKRRTGHERLLAEMREEVNNIIRFINEATDRDITLIEEREKNLSALLKETEKRINTYIREMEVRKEADNTYAALRSEEKPSATYQALGKNRYKGIVPDASPEVPGIPSGAGKEPELAKDTLPPLSPPTANMPTASLPPTTSQPPANPPSTGEQIRSLLRSGLSESVIASRLGITISEVEFAAALLERRDDK